MIAANELRSMERADLLVSVPLQKYTSVDYNKADEIIKAGYDAAASKSAVLSTFSVDESTWKQIWPIGRPGAKVRPCRSLSTSWAGDRNWRTTSKIVL